VVLAFSVSIAILKGNFPFSEIVIARCSNMLLLCQLVKSIGAMLRSFSLLALTARGIQKIPLFG
jgi:hypothetical protein